MRRSNDDDYHEKEFDFRENKTRDRNNWNPRQYDRRPNYNRPYRRNYPPRRNGPFYRPYNRRRNDFRPRGQGNFKRNFNRSRGRGQRGRGRGYRRKDGFGFTPYRNFFGQKRTQVVNKADPHLSQNPNFEKINSPFNLQMRILGDDAPETEYYSRKSRGERMSVNHWGQRKLLMSEIEFLSLYFDINGEKEPPIVVYAGAAPGTHIKFLSDLFPMLKFVCVDPAKFSLQKSEKIEIKQEYFTDEMAKSYCGKDVLFISDVRSANHRVMEYEENEEQIKTDMKWQMDWVNLMKPRKAMLKFRLPYFEKDRYKPEDTFPYLDGDIFLPVWGRQSTTESRLVCEADKIKEYGIKKYESQMFHFNTKTRVQYYPHKVNVKGLDHCFDCRSEVFILSTYLQKVRKITDNEALCKAVEEMVPQISRECSPKTGRTLSYIEPTQCSFLTDEEKNFERERTKKITSYVPLSEMEKGGVPDSQVNKRKTMTYDDEDEKKKPEKRKRVEEDMEGEPDKKKQKLPDPKLPNPKDDGGDE